MSENKNVSKEIKNLPENLKGIPQDIIAMMLSAGHSTKSPLQDSIEEKAEGLVELGNDSMLDILLEEILRLSKL